MSWKIRAFVNFFHTLFSGKDVFPLKVTELPRL